MKSLKLRNLSGTILGAVAFTMIFSSAIAQEYDDMYFNKKDRKTVRSSAITDINNSKSTTDYKKISQSTEAYSAKNVNPEYIARYKKSNQNESVTSQNKSYGSKDYFVEDFENDNYVSDSNKNKIDYAALALRDKMSYSNYNRSFSSPSWGFNPYMNMNFGYPMYGGRYGYDPFMMGYNPGFSMGFGTRFGYGISPFVSYSIGMSWGTGYNPWSSWGGYPSLYNSPYGYGGFYDPWGYSYGNSAFNNFYGSYNPYYRSSLFYGYGSPSVIVVKSKQINEHQNGRNIYYKSRSTRSSVTPETNGRATESNRMVSNSSHIRVPSRISNASQSNGRVSRDYSKVQNEYYNTARRKSNSSQRISTTSSRSRYFNNQNNSKEASSYSHSISNNKPSRSYTSSSSRSYSNRSTYSGNSSKSRSSSYNSFSSPTRSSSSFGRSSYSSGSSNRSSGYSSGSSRSSGSSGRSSSSSRSGGRQ